MDPVIAKRYCYVRRHFPLYFLLIMKSKSFSDYQNRIIDIISNKMNEEIIRQMTLL